LGGLIGPGHMVTLYHRSPGGESPGAS
jgi:hypothetical protein